MYLLSRVKCSLPSPKIYDQHNSSCTLVANYDNDHWICFTTIYVRLTMTHIEPCCRSNMKYMWIRSPSGEINWVYLNVSLQNLAAATITLPLLWLAEHWFAFQEATLLDHTPKVLSVTDIIILDYKVCSWYSQVNMIVSSHKKVTITS